MHTAFLHSFEWVTAAVALAVGLSVGLTVWLLGRSLNTVPGESREYKDPPPWGFRLFWWPIRWISHWGGPWIPGNYRQAVWLKLRQAGLDFSITAEQYLAGRVVAAGLCAAVTGWLVGSFDRPGGAGPGWGWGVYAQALLVAGLAGGCYPALWLKDCLSRRQRDVLKSLPFFLDLITLCIEAGLNLQGALNQAVVKGPAGPLRDEFQRVLRDVRAGKGRAASLRDMAERLQQTSINNFVTAVAQAEAMGMNLGPVLRAQADQRRFERFQRAEKLAMQAPVKMLFPLIAFIFPCTFVVLFFPIAMKFMHSGL
jgi:tight adherence protein C